MSDENNPTTLYVGNLDDSISTELLCTLFMQMGPVTSCKIIREPGNTPYAFIDFANHRAASTALTAMNKRIFLEKKMKVNWAISSGNETKPDTSSHHHIFVGDLCDEITTQALKDAFAPFGEISNCRIVKDPQTLKSKGYAFLSFVNKADAQTAIVTMNGQKLGTKNIRTNWSDKKPPLRKIKTRTFEEIYNQSSPTNRTVYCGGFVSPISDELMKAVFSPFGDIQEMRCFKNKGYAFIKFKTKEAAVRAIQAIHKSEIQGETVKCFWGNELPNTTVAPVMNEPGQSGEVGAAQSLYTYNCMRYWYPQGYTASGHMQYPYAAAASYGQPNYAAGMQMPAQPSSYTEPSSVGMQKNPQLP